MGKAKGNKRIIVAMSGGVDSSVAAALLRVAGFDVVGVFMKFWSEKSDDLQVSENRCCSLDSEKRARQVAKILDIPFYVFNFEKEFKKTVVDYFLKESGLGKTPNPCVICNKEIKFGLLIKKALSLGFDYIATGHYARLKEKDGKLHLLKSKDKNKDQSYFLWKLSQKQLKHVMFPVGNYAREEVEKLAKEFKLPFANVKKSMEVCFIPSTTEKFLARHLKMRKGKIIRINGGRKKIVGEHEGLPLYTIGQRKGIKLAGGPFYVVEKDMAVNEVIITMQERDLLQKEISAKDVGWVSGEEPKFPLKAQVKIRYRAASVFAKIYKAQDAKYKILFTRPQRAVTPGQSAVFYIGEELLGGAIII
jgi:tRNA-uridine 2-sulfurtransferase